MRLLRLLSLPYARKHRLRTLLTIAGIVLGIAVYVAMNAANQAVLGSFNETVDRIAGRAELQVTAGETGFDEEVLERVQNAPCVDVAAPVIEAVVEPGLRGEGNLLVLAIDMTGDRSLRDYDLEDGEEDVIDDPLVFLAQPDSIIVTRDFAARQRLAIGSHLPMQTMDGAKTLVVRGIMRPGGMASAFGGNLAIMDIYAAQMIFGRGRKFDRVDLRARPDAPLPVCQEQLRAALGPGFEVEAPAARGKFFASLLRVYSLGVGLSSWFALFIGMFIIYNSFAIAVSQRRPEIGILRALGATQGQVRVLFLAESAVAGLAGSALGVAVGILLARGLALYVNSMFAAIHGVVGQPEVSLRPGLLASALAVGVATSVAAAWIPAREAARVDPVKALQKGRGQILGAGENRWRGLAATLLLAGSVAALRFARHDEVLYAAFLAIGLAALLYAPFLVEWLTRALRPVLKAIWPVEGSLAADSLLQAPRRTSATVAALMLSLAMVISLAGIARASYASILDWADSTLNPDLFVSTSETLSSRNFRFPEEMTPQLAAVPGITEIQRVRTLRIKLNGAPVVLIAIEFDLLASRTRGRRVIEGNYDEMHRLAREGKGAIISESLSQLQQLHLGDTLEIPTPAGPLRLPVAGVVTEYSGQQGSIGIDRSVYERYWNDRSVDVFRVYLLPGVRPETVKQTILERFGGQRRLFVLMNEDVRGYILRVTDQWFGMTYLQILIAVLVAVLGIVNTLTVSITDRRRELGVLRAVGGLPVQIRHTICLEAAAIGVAGLLLGWLLGAVGLSFQLEMVRRSFSGMLLAYTFPWSTAALLAPVILGAAWLAALGPAEAAVRSSLVEALEYE